MTEKTLAGAGLKKAKPYFIWWEQNVTEDDVREALASDNIYTRITFMSYIVNDADFEDIWQFLKLRDVQENFWRIRWRTNALRDGWRQMLTFLGYPPDECADPIAARILS